MSETYPNLDPDAVWVLQIIAKNVRDNPEYLKSPDCPYPEEVKQLFEKQTGLAQFAEDGEDFNLDSIDMETEIISLYKRMQSWGNSIQNSDKSEQNTYFRLSTQLQERLIELMERSKGLKEIEQFKTAILSFMDDHMDPDTRTKFMDHIGDHLNG